jgi:lipopolysaccharide transport system ATP-binding protein
MSNIAIRVENLGKQYRIGGPRGRFRYKSLRESLTEAVQAPFRRAVNLLRGEAFGGAEMNETIWALKNVSFKVKRGEVVGIIGRNGAGKTTLLKILSRITEPTEGYAEIHGRVGSLLEVGTGFHPELTGRDNVYLSGAILGMKRAEIERKFDEIVAFAEVEKFVDTPVKHYSSGMYLRLAFSVAAHLEPEILLIDEVLAVGDAAFQKKCLGKMGDVAKEGRTVLFVSHNMGAVASLCKLGIVIEGGRIKEIGQVNDAIATYMQGAQDLPDSQSLLNHPNRAKGFKGLLTSFTLETSNGVVHYGKPLTLRIGYNFGDRTAIPQFCVVFKTMSGVRAFTLVSDYQSNDIPNSLQGKGEVQCTVDSLPLLPGQYIMDLMLWQPGQKLDDIENVASFQVEWLDRSYGQFNWDASKGVVYVDANWQLCNDSGT